MPFFKNRHSCYMVVSSCFRLMTVIIAIMSSIIFWITGTQKFFHILDTVQIFATCKDPLQGRMCESTDTISSAVMVSIH